MLQSFTTDLPASEQFLYRTASATVALLCLVWCTKVYSILPEPYLVGYFLVHKDLNCFEAKKNFGVG